MCTLLFHVSFHCVEHLSLTPPPSLKKRVGLSQKPVKTKFYYRVHTVTNSAHPDKRGCNVWCYVLVTLFVCFIATHNEKYSYLSPKNEIGIYRNWCNIITLIRLSEGDLRIRLFPPFPRNSPTLLLITNCVFPLHFQLLSFLGEQKTKCWLEC